MKRILYVCLFSQLLLPLTSLAADRSTLHHQRPQTLREKEIVPLTVRSGSEVTSPVRSPSPQNMTSDVTYAAMLIQSRAKHRPVAHNGLVMYNAVVIRQYDPEEHAGLSGGNVVASSDVKYLYNVTIVKDRNVRTVGGDSVELGNVQHEGDAKEVVNLVEVRGTIAAPRVSVGNVTNIGNVQRILNSLNIGGSSSNW